MGSCCQLPVASCQSQCQCRCQLSNMGTVVGRGFSGTRFASQGMGKVFESIDEKLEAWLSAQRVFFVATAPLSAAGHVNCSPKDGESFRVIDERTVVYLDLTGSGVETIAHVRENERIVLMFCAFTGAPKIVPLHGRGEVVEPWNR